MARPPKRGLDYFPLDVHLDDKFKLIEAEYGLDGFAIVIKLLQKIYGEHGYYCEWTNEVALLFGRDIGAGGKVVSEIVSASIKRGIFDSCLFNKYHILTSKGIQTRYFEAVSRRRGVAVESKYLLVSAIQNTESDGKTPVYVYNNSPKSDSNATKEKKRNKSIKKEIEPPTRADVELFCRERRSPVDPGRFYDYFTADTENPWHDRDGRPVTNWQQRLIGWEQHEKREPGKQIPPEDDVLQNTYFNPLFSDKKGG